MNKPTTTSKDTILAKIIIQQIKTGDPWALSVWGAHNFIALPDTTQDEFNEATQDYEPKNKMPLDQHRLGGVMFEVSGYKFTGTVVIELALNDTYRVTFLPYHITAISFENPSLFTLPARLSNLKNTKKMTEIYCDELFQAIDDAVCPEYYLPEDSSHIYQGRIEIPNSQNELDE